MANLLSSLQLVAGAQRGYNGGSTSVVANIPSGTQPGDVVVVVAAARNHNVNPGGSGYTTIQGASGSSESGISTPWVGYRLYQTGDTIPSTITLSGNSHNNGTASATFRSTSGAPLTQINIVGLTSASGSGSSTSAGSVTATETIGTLLVGVGANSGNNNNQFSFSSSMDELGDSGSSGGRMCGGLYNDTDPIVVGSNSFPSVSLGRSEPWGRSAFILQGYVLDLWAGSHAPSLAGDGVGYGGSMALGRAPYAGYGSVTGSFPPTFTISAVSPAESAKIPQTQPTFTVLPNSTDGSAMTIEWQWDTNTNFDNSSGLRQTKQTTGNADEVNANTTPDVALGYHTYYWRARAGDGSGSWSTYTEPRSFDVQAVPVEAAAYFQMNTGFAAALLQDTGLSANEFYLNIGFPEALISEYGPASSTFQLNVGEPPEDINVTGDADKQFQMYVVSRIDGTELPPTIN